MIRCFGCVDTFSEIGVIIFLSYTYTEYILVFPSLDGVHGSPGGHHPWVWAVALARRRLDTYCFCPQRLEIFKPSTLNKVSPFARYDFSSWSPQYKKDT